MYKKHYPLVANGGPDPQKSNGQQQLRISTLESFRIEDLIRSKLQCSEDGYIHLLKTMDIIHQSEMMNKKFKLVRIKNKLSESAQNIIINYLFMNKIQCELQLSIQEMSTKSKNNYLMSHFVYELTRGAFGPISECTILDPLITSCKQPYSSYKPKRVSFPRKRKKRPKRKVPNENEK